MWLSGKPSLNIPSMHMRPQQRDSLSWPILKAEWCQALSSSALEVAVHFTFAQISLPSA